MVLEPTLLPEGILSCCLASDGRRYDLLCQPAGGSRMPASAETVAKHLHSVHMSGNEVFKFAVRYMVELAQRAIQESGLRVEELDLLIPHQANLRIIDQTAKRLGIPPERVYVNLDRYGNTSSASIPMALDEAREKGVIGKGSTVAVVAFGGGFTYGAAVLRL